MYIRVPEDIQPCAHFQALPMVTVMVGRQTSSDVCRLLTTAPVEPCYAQFVLADVKKDAPVKVEPAWVNYVRGVVACYPGEPALQSSQTSLCRFAVKSMVDNFCQDIYELEHSIKT